MNDYSDYLGVRNFCAGCKGSKVENGELMCRDKSGRFYNLPVKWIICAPCIKPKSKAEMMENKQE